MEVVSPQPPDGQHFLLREYLQTLFAKAPFNGEAWTACTKAFLGFRAIPVLGSNFTTLAPASFFLSLYADREPDFGTDRDGRLGEADFRRTLSELGEQKLQMLIATDLTRSWAIYLSEDLKAILAFHGRLKPGPRFSSEDDERDIAHGKVVRDVLPGEPAKIDKLDLSDVSSAKVEVTDARGQRYQLTFRGCMRVQHPAPGNEIVARALEVHGLSGRTWFVFGPAEPGSRPFAIQAESVTITHL